MSAYDSDTRAPRSVLSTSASTISTFGLVAYRSRSIAARARSYSTAITRRARSRRMSVSAPRPAPISRIVSSGRGSSASTMRDRMCRSARKCWPRLFRTGGSAVWPRRFTSAPQRHDRQVVAAASVSRVLVEQPENIVEHLRGMLLTMLARDLDDFLLAKTLPLPVPRVADAVSEQQEQIPRGPLAARAGRRAGAHAERWVEGRQTLDLAALRNHERVRMAGVRVAQTPGIAIDDGIEQGDVH